MANTEKLTPRVISNKHIVDALKESTRLAEMHRDKVDQKLEASNEKLEKILVQTTKTNGRVNAHDQKLELLSMDVKALNEKKQITKGRDGVLLFILSLTCGILSAYIIYLLTQKH